MKDRFWLFAAGMLATTAPLWSATKTQSSPPPVWPIHFEGRPLQRIAPTALDQRLARHFPGHIARFTDGGRQVVLRSLAGATRQLHPARDCFSAIGYRLRPLPMVRRAGGALSSCFAASRNGVTLKICEQVIARDGTSYPDVQSWYWPALLGQSPGPWLATMTVERTS